MGTTSSFFGGGGGSPLPEPEWLFQKSSYTYTFPYDGVVRVHVVGAGGSGGVQNNGYSATGGGAGGYSRKQFTVTSSTTATVTTGVGGARVGQGVQNADGNAGTASTFVLGSTTLTANGGTGGTRYGTTSKGLGGSATGGDINYTGGNGGARQGQYNDYAQATGGGAVNLFNLTTDGGSFTNAGRNAATGGGGVGGRGGNITNGGYYHITGGGGSAGPADDIPNSSNTSAGNSNGGAGGARLFLFNGPFLDGQGGNPIRIYNYSISSYGMTVSPPSTIGIGAGSGGIAGWEQNVPGASVFIAQKAGIFGGGGGCYVGQHEGSSAGDATVGGGGGAHAFRQGDSNPQRFSGKGGQGVVIIEYIERT